MAARFAQPPRIRIALDNCTRPMRECVPFIHGTLELIQIHHAIAAASPTVGKMFSRWVRHLGAIGFIPLGLLDSSVIPLPGSMDILTIVLAARDEQLWYYYATMATVGSVLGAYVTYHLARKGGREALERRFSRAKIARVSKLFARWGFGSIAIPAILPPPMPMVPFIFAAGAMQYSVGKFIAAMALGRIIRYSVLAYLAARYGRQMRTFIAHSGNPALFIALGLVALAIGIFVFIRFGKRKPNPRPAA
jgi:membrane protein YqaA with SNARE-associated domain